MIDINRGDNYLHSQASQSRKYNSKGEVRQTPVGANENKEMSSLRKGMDKRQRGNTELIIIGIPDQNPGIMSQIG